MKDNNENNKGHPPIGTLMFGNLEVLEEDDREPRFLELYKRVDAGDIPGEILSKEPESFVDINNSFYLFPAVDYRELDQDSDELRLVRLATALPGERAGGSYYTAALKGLIPLSHVRPC